MITFFLNLLKTGLMVSALIGLPVFAQFDFSFNADTKQLKVATEQCLYGRGVQKGLSKQTYTQVRQYINQHADKVLSSLDPNNQLSPQKRNYMNMVLQLQLDEDSFEHDYYLLGSETCTNAKAVLPISDELNFETFFQFQPEHSLHFIGAIDRVEAKISQRLAEYNITADTTLIDKYTKRVAEFNQNQQAQVYLVFDLQRYLSESNSNKNRVYVSGSASFIEPLQNYLTSLGYQVVTSEANAFWNIQVEGTLEQGQYVAINMNIHNSNNIEFRLSNNSRALPKVNLNNPAMLDKMLKVHFRLMKLEENLQ